MDEMDEVYLLDRHLIRNIMTNQSVWRYHIVGQTHIPVQCFLGIWISWLPVAGIDQTSAGQLGLSQNYHENGSEHWQSSHFRTPYGLKMGYVMVCPQNALEFGKMRNHHDDDDELWDFDGFLMDF